MPAKRKLPHRFKRIGQWLKQVILLGRTDWRKASDDASPPRLSRRQREELQPQFDVNAIKPRNVSALDRVEGSTPAVFAPLSEPPPDAAAQAPADESLDGAPKPSKSRVFRRQRRERPAQIAVNPLSAFTPDKLPATRLERLVEKFFGGRR